MALPLQTVQVRNLDTASECNSPGLEDNHTVPDASFPYIDTPVKIIYMKNCNFMFSTLELLKDSSLEYLWNLPASQIP